MSARRSSSILRRQNRDSRELADAAGQNGVREQADAERGEDGAERRLRRRQRLLDHLVPGARPRDHRQEVERDRGDDPLPGDEPERVDDETPIRAVPDEERDHARERDEHERARGPTSLSAASTSYAANAFGDSTSRLVDLGQSLCDPLPGVALLCEHAGRATQVCPRRFVLEQGDDRLGQRMGIVGRNEAARLAAP